MIIGILSDSHGKVDRVRKAVELFKSRGVKVIVHCGDIGSAECLETLAAGGMAVFAVAGNTDRHISRLRSVAENHNIVFGEVVRLPLGNGRCLIATHGHDGMVTNQLLADGNCTILCHGHTHRTEDSRRGNTQIINPGALNHPRDHRGPSVAILDTNTDELTFEKIR